MMKYYSLNKNTAHVDFREATLLGLAPDKGLFFPESILQFPNELKNEIESLPDEEIAYQAIKPYVSHSIPEDRLRKIVSETINFPMPLVQLSQTLFALELFHGPTLAFKDVGARFMSRCLGYFAENENKKITVLVATSGDTGGAVADGFHGVDAVQVVILYPSGKVSEVQEKQLTTHGNNIHALEVKGNFDDCQRIVKEIFNDARIKNDLCLTSANSINVARWLPQQFYYLFAWKQWGSRVAPVIAVPSGNFGNLCAAMLSHVSGMPVSHFIAACNSNDTIPRYLETGRYEPHETVATLSNAMDVSNPSNFVRIVELYKKNPGVLKQILSAVRVSEDDTSSAMKDGLREYRYQLDPHGAVAYHALNAYQRRHPDRAGYFVETAHPVKFYNSVKKITGSMVDLPEKVRIQLGKQKHSIGIEANKKRVVDFLYAIS